MWILPPWHIRADKQQQTNHYIQFSTSITLTIIRSFLASHFTQTVIFMHKKTYLHLFWNSVASSELTPQMKKMTPKKRMATLKLPENCRLWHHIEFKSNGMLAMWVVWYPGAAVKTSRHFSTNLGLRLYQDTISGAACYVKVIIGC